MIGMNPILIKNNTIVTLHFNDEECSSKQLASYNELHGDNASGLHRVTPYAVKHQVGLHELVVLPSKLVEDGVRYQVDDDIDVDEHSRDRLPINVTSNV
jgi:hypothetical protein